MSSPNDPPKDSEREDFENPLDVIPFVKKAKEAKSFFKTRKAILKREPLYNFTRPILHARGLQGPWAFDLTQSFVGSIPGMTLGAFIGMKWPGVSPAVSADVVHNAVSAALAPLQGPLTLLLVVYGVGYACLPYGHVTKRNWKAAQRKYLYFDAACGLWPQFILALSTAMVGVPASEASRNATAAGVLLAGKIILLATLLWITFYEGLRIQYELFYYDYLPDEPEGAISKLGAPMLKFYGVTGFAIPIALGWVAVIFNLTSTILTKLLHQLI